MCSVFPCTPAKLSVFHWACAHFLSFFPSPGNAYLAQSPQLYKQMAICGDMERVFEVGPGESEGWWHVLFSRPP